MHQIMLNNLDNNPDTLNKNLKSSMITRIEQFLLKYAGPSYSLPTGLSESFGLYSDIGLFGLYSDYSGYSVIQARTW